MKRCFALIVLISLMAALSGACTPPPAIPATPATSGKEAGSAAAPAEISAWDKIVKEARKEGKLVIYSINGPEVRKLLIETMKERYGIEVDYTTGPGADLAQRLLSERRANIRIADVVLFGTQIFTHLKPADAVINLDDSLLLPEVRDTKAWPEGRFPFLDKDHTGIGLTGAYWSYVLVNTDMVKDGDLTSYRDLARPIWKDKLSMGNPTVGGSTINWMMFMREKIMPPNEGDGFLREVARQNPAINHDYRTQVEWVARGKYPVSLHLAPDIVSQFKKEGAPIAWRRLKEGGMVHPSGSIYSISSSAPHPNAAKLLLNWLLTKEGQERYSVSYQQPAVRLDVSASGIEPFMVVIPGEKVVYWDEEFGIKTQIEGPKIAREVFGSLLR